MSDMDQFPEGRGTSLRREAESRLRLEPADPVDLGPEGIRRLVHELQVHQLELQMQNEELRRTQAKLEAARARYFDLYDLAPVGYLTLDEPGVVLEANLTTARLLSVDRAELLGHPLTQFILPADQDIYYHLQRQLFQSRTPRVCEVRLRRASGTTVWARLEAMVAQGTETEIPVCRLAISDVTERVRLEQELVRDQRLRAIGELSSGISHNLNNILTAVLMPAQMLLRRADDAQTRELVEMILAAGSRAQDLIHRLHLAVAGSGKNAAQPVSLAPAIHGAVAMARPRWQDEPESRGLTIEVRTDLGEVPPVAATETGLQDALTALLLNSVEAMPAGGTITIRTALEGDTVRLDFSDTGTGMDEPTQLRVFEPMFTTKMDVGSGLGLATLHRTVTAWGGTVRVTSAPGEGTTFSLFLPVWGSGAQPPPQTTEPLCAGGMQ
jgi:PAS domain S-box-containing protein